MADHAHSQPSRSSHAAAHVSTPKSAGRDVTPSSALLQDLLREKKAQSQRDGRKPRDPRSTAAAALLSMDDGIFGVEKGAQSSPVRRERTESDEPGSGRRRSDVAALKKNRAVGVREMDDIIDGLNKQNFALKLELYHRRDRMTELEQRLDALKHLEDENFELQEVNDDLLRELQQRDKAIEEAVAIICDLEEKLEWHKNAEIQSRPSTAQPETDTSTLKGSDTTPQTSPGDTVEPITPTRKAEPKLTAIKNASPRNAVSEASPARSKTSSKPHRTPSFLTSEASTNAGALRSLYLAGENKNRTGSGVFNIKRFDGTISRDQLPIEHDGLDSPRLSVLSESSFLSVYGEAKRQELDLGKPLIPIEPAPLDTANKNLRSALVERWMEEPSPSKPTRTAINTTIPAVSVLKKTPLAAEPGRHSPRQEITAYRVRSKKDSRLSDPRSINHSFGANFLPPTPDTMSAGDNDLSRDPSQIAEKSLRETARIHALRSAALAQPRPLSAGVDPGSTRNHWKDIEYDDLASSDGDLESLFVEQSDSGNPDDFALDLTQLSVMSTLSPQASKSFKSQAPGVARLGEFQGNILFSGGGLGLSPVNLSDQCSHGYHVMPQPGNRSSSLHQSNTRSRLHHDRTARSSQSSDPSVLHADALTPAKRRLPKDAEFITSNRTPELPKEAENITPATESRFASLRFKSPKTSSTGKRGSITSRFWSRNAATTEATKATLADEEAPVPPPHRQHADEISRPVKPINVPRSSPRYHVSTGSLDSRRGPYTDFDIPGPESRRRRPVRSPTDIEPYRNPRASFSAHDLTVASFDDQRFDSKTTTPTAARHGRRSSVFRIGGDREKERDKDVLPTEPPTNKVWGLVLGRTGSVKGSSEPSTRSASRSSFMAKLGRKEKI